MGPEDYAMGETTKTLIEIINGKMPAGINGSFNLCDVRDLADGVAEVRRFDLEPPQLLNIRPVVPDAKHGQIIELRRFLYERIYGFSNALQDLLL